MSSRNVRDSDLLDALEASKKIEHHGTVWRVVRADRDPLRSSAPGGRWDDGTFDVLYTSVKQDGAIAEMHYHLSRGQPVFPSQMDFKLHELAVKLDRGLMLADLTAVEALGVDTSRYGALDYSRTQEIAEAAHFYDFDGLIVPNARWNCQNVVVFTDRVGPESLSAIHNHGRINWVDWRKANL